MTDIADEVTTTPRQVVVTSGVAPTPTPLLMHAMSSSQRTVIIDVELAFTPLALMARGLLIADLGWSREEAAEVRAQLAAFEEDWDAPGMDAYDAL